MAHRPDRSDSGFLPAAPRGRQGRGRLCAILFLFALALLAAPAASAGTFLDIQTTAGGINVTQVNNTLFTTGFGNMNALGVGTPSVAGVTAIPVAGGTLYITRIGLFIKGALPAGHRAWVSAYVSVNFAHPAALVAYGCSYPQACNASGQFSALSLNAGAPSILVPQPGITKNTTVAAGIAIFVPETNGAGAYAGTDSATLHVLAFDFDNGNTQLDDNTFTLNNPLENVQTAVQLTLSSAAGGVPVTPATDFALNYGNVNGMGIAPGAGLTTTAGTGGFYYVTPYQINPVFSSFASTTASVKVYVSTDFAHPLVLQLNDAAAAAGPFTAVSKLAGAQTSLSTAAANRSTLTRYLGLFVSDVNGATSYRGIDTATLTYTLTVP